MQRKACLGNLCLFLICVFALFSCGIPFSGGNGASISVKIGGAVPLCGQKNPAASRALSPTTATISVRAVEAGGQAHSAAAAYDPNGTALTLAALPVGVLLDISVLALDADGEPITSWNVSRTLAPGETALSAVLAPAEADVNDAAFSSYPLAGESAGLDRGQARFDTFSGLPAGDEIQAIYDTGKAEFAWLEAYDSSWRRLAPIAGDQENGWVAVRVPENGIVNVASANSVSSPGYPARRINGRVQIRRAYFLSVNGSGTGTSADPGTFSQDFIDDAPSGCSLFLREGAYTFSEFIEIAKDLMMFGGFDENSWARRDTVDFPSVLYLNGYGGLAFYNNFSNRFDGFTTYGRIAGMSESCGLTLSNNAGMTMVVYDCTLNGAPSAEFYDGDALSVALRITDGSPEISSCAIEAGTMVDDGSTLGYVTAVLYGIEIMNSSYPYIHNCSIDGGRIETGPSNRGTAMGIRIENNAGAVLSGCGIWGGRVSISTAATALTIGVLNEGSGRLTASSCLISGGYSYGGGGNALSRGVEVSDSTGELVGCTIDGGYALPDGSSCRAIHFSQAAAMDFTVSACLFLNSSAEDVSSYALHQVNDFPLTRISGNAFFDCRPGFFSIGPITDLDGLNALNEGNNDGDSATTAANEFADYTAPPSTFAAFSSIDWRPSPAAQYAGSSSAEGPSTWGVESAIAQYPALGMDLAGRPRPSSWARGAYER